MKIKNAYIFTLACSVLACDYAITGYPTPSIFLSCVVVVLSLGVLNPSRETVRNLAVQSICIALIEVTILILIEHASTWTNAFLVTSIVISCGCWSKVYLRSKKYVKNFILNSIQVMSTLLIVAMLLVLGIPNLTNNTRLEIVKFLILIFLPIFISIFFTYLQKRLKYNINLESKKIHLHQMKR